jgi:methylmalonyl-CoA mutase
MAEPTIHDIISRNFSSISKDEWQRAASVEMPKNISLENLLWSVDGLAFSPYYMKDDLRGTEYLQLFHHRSHQLVPPPWLNMPDIRVIDENTANEKALSFLRRGADGIVFDITDLQVLDIERLINKINWNHCPVSFKISDTKVVTDIFAYAEEKYDMLELMGSIWWKHLVQPDQLPASVKQFLVKYKKYHLFGIEVPASSPVKEISGALLQCVKLVDELTDLGIDRDVVFRSVSLSLACDENFLINIVKLRTMRILWYQLSQSFELSDYLPTDLKIRCRSGKDVDEKFQPHGDIIRNTCQAVSAITGGCNEITITGDQGADSMTDRVALNVSNILKEESHFDKVADPLAGSYAVEKMVHELSQAAWTDFQKQQS